MATKSSVNKNARRRRLTAKFKSKRSELKATIRDRDRPTEERFAAVLKLAELPRNSSVVRIRNRCALTGRPRGNYRKFRLSRNALRDMALKGQIPGMVKASW